jgi:hypothetical protein
MDFIAGDGIEMHIGNIIRGVNTKGVPVQGILSTFNDGDVILEDDNRELHVVAYKDVKHGHYHDYVAVVCEKEDWDNPTIRVIRALDEDGVYSSLADSMEHTVESLEEGEEEGDISIIIHKAKDISL